MSFKSTLTEIWDDIKSLFKKVVTDAPVVIQDAQIAIAGIAPLVELGAAELDPPVAAAITAGVNIALPALSELGTVVATYQKTPTTTTMGAVQNAMSSVQSNLAGILAASKVKSTATTNKIETIVNGVVTDLTVLESSILAVHPITVAAPTPVTPTPAS